MTSFQRLLFNDIYRIHFAPITTTISTRVRVDATLARRHTAVEIAYPSVPELSALEQMWVDTECHPPRPCSLPYPADVERDPLSDPYVGFPRQLPFEMPAPVSSQVYRAAVASFGQPLFCKTAHKETCFCLLSGRGEDCMNSCCRSLEDPRRRSRVTRTSSRVHTIPIGFPKNMRLLCATGRPSSSNEAVSSRGVKCAAHMGRAGLD